jgi:hypothetical protein
LGLSVDSKATTIKNTTYFIAMVISFVLFITSLVLAVVFERIYEKILDKHELTQPTVPSATVTSV